MRYTYVTLAAPAPGWKVLTDIERVLEASVGPAWAGLEKEAVSLTESFTRFSEPDIPSLKATVTDYRGPVERLCYETTGDVYSSSTVWVDADMRTEHRIIIYTAVDNRVDAERLDHALAENIEILGRRQSSLWHRAKVVREPLTQHVNAKSPSEDGTSVVRAKGIRTRIRRWFVLNRDGIIISLATGFVGSLVVIGLQLAGIIPTPS